MNYLGAIIQAQANLCSDNVGGSSAIPPQKTFKYTNLGTVIFVNNDPAYFDGAMSYGLISEAWAALGAYIRQSANCQVEWQVITANGEKTLGSGWIAKEPPTPRP